MSCYHPMKALRSADGGVRFLSEDAKVFNLRLPCGRCIGCRLERSRQWAIRCSHEAQLHEHNSFVTLTYNDDNLPVDRSLNYRDFQLFMKRLRKAVAPLQFRFYMCGEYGEECGNCGMNANDCSCGKWELALGRPHFHVCFFGLDFSDKILYKKNLFRSPLLESCWKFGFSTVAKFSFETAAYVARYVMKKITGDVAEVHYEYVVPETGEVVVRVPEFNSMSRRPGIGARWFKKFSTDVFPSDEVVFNGVTGKPPRFYDRSLRHIDPDLYDNVVLSRVEKSKLNLYDSCSDRLSVREQVTSARISRFKRSL
ncbi:MAG: replication initiator protein [Microvirus sp.]|nr:MAG: replication initiator protein [Microvirus sp.]